MEDSHLSDGRLRTGSNGRPRVVFLMGAGRSGSTVLGIALGGLSACFYAGELFAWPLFRGEANSEKPDILDFWRRVRSGVAAPEQFYGDRFHRRLEHSRALLIPWRLARGPLIESYRSWNRALLRRIQSETDAAFVVDSSHYPLRAWQLMRDPELDVYLIHLVRDPREVIQALQKQTQRHRPMGPLAANLYCLSVWLLSSAVFALAPRERRLRIRYEDFLDEPAGAVRRVAALLQVTPDVESFSELATGPIFHGNRLRRMESIAISRQPQARTLGRVWWLVSTLLQLPALLAHRYEIWRRLPPDDSSHQVNNTQPR